MVLDAEMRERLQCESSATSDVISVYTDVYQVNASVFELYKDADIPAPMEATIRLTDAYRIKNQIVSCLFMNTTTGEWGAVQVR